MRKRRKQSDKISSEKLFAWAIPTFLNQDHTWVTTFDLHKHRYKNITGVGKANELYWYCYGDLHFKGRLLATERGSRSLSSCLVQPNLRSQESDPAKGTIFQYGIHGVCHQLTNQVLFSTGMSGPAITVKDARGYMASTFVYGMYGKNVSDWEQRKRGCKINMGSSESDESSMGHDDFENRATEVLKESPDLLKRLLALREDVLMDRPDQDASAADINKKNQLWFDKAANILGPAHFKAIFGYHPSDRVSLVDPELMSGKSHTLHATDLTVQKPEIATPTITLKHLAAALAETHEMTKRQAETVLGDLVGDIVKHLKKGERIRIGGLGILQVRKLAARMGRNPATGEQVRIKASKKVAFRPSKELREKVDA